MSVIDGSAKAEQIRSADKEWVNAAESGGKRIRKDRQSVE